MTSYPLDQVLLDHALLAPLALRHLGHHQVPRSLLLAALLKKQSVFLLLCLSPHLPQAFV
jgi:hypothetical protein